MACCLTGEMMKVGDRVEYQTGVGSSGIGRVIAYDPETEVVTVKDEDDGTTWRGLEDYTEPAPAEKVQFSASLLGMWDEMQPNIREHKIEAVRNGDMATFTGQADDIDCFISKHYDGTGTNIVVTSAEAE